MASLLSVENLQVQFQTKKGINTAVDGVSFSVEKGRILGIVGESGCGKSVTSMSILQLLGMTALNPTLTIGTQLMEPIMLHQNCGKKEAWTRAVDVLKRVGIAAPEKRMKEYPHQLSGGMRQRVMIAMAVSCEPRLLIADEPTTALDVTIQAQILELMCELREKMGTAIMLITHDMGVVAETADDVLVLYAGKAVEYGSIEDIFERPKHPYTQGLLNSIPRLDEDVELLNTIEGTVPAPDAMPAGCRFAPRCPYGKDRCMKEKPGVYHAGNSLVSCFRYEGEKE